jgi:hypothetical protein
VGASWKRKIKQFEPEAGFSFYHVNHPQESFYDATQSKAPIRSTFYASVKTDINQNLYIKPGVMFFLISGSYNMMVGSQFGSILQGNSFNVKDAYGGVYLRSGFINQPDAIMLMVGAQVHSLNIAISYDINISQLSTYTDHQGAFEISFIYKSISTIIKTFTIPCERI